MLAHGLGAKGLFLALLGLMGIYLKQAQKLGVWGLVAFLLSFMATADLIIIYGLATLVEPALATNALDLLDPAGPLYGGLFGLFFLKALIAFIVGYVAFGILTYRAKIIPGLGGILLAAGVLPFALFLTGQEYPFIVFQFGGSIFSLGLIWLGYNLWSKGA